MKNRLGAGAYKKNLFPALLPVSFTCRRFARRFWLWRVTFYSHARAQTTKIRYTMYVQRKEKRKKRRSIVVRTSYKISSTFFFFCIFLVFPRIRSIISNTIDRRSTTIERQAIVRWRRKEISAAVPATGRWYSVCSRVGSLGNNK